MHSSDFETSNNCKFRIEGIEVEAQQSQDFILKLYSLYMYNM